MKTNERWLPIDYPGEAYEVSDRGRVRSLDRWVHRRNPRHFGPARLKRTGKVLSPGKLKNGHRYVHLYIEGEKITRYVHHLVLGTFVCPRPIGMEGCHENGKPGDNRLENLRWDTHSSNSEDSRRHGTMAMGERTGTSKLTEQKVREVRRRLSEGETQSGIARELGVGRGCVSRIHNRKAWRHLA